MGEKFVKERDLGRFEASLCNFRFFKWNVLTFEEYKLTPFEKEIFKLKIRPECLRNVVSFRLFSLLSVYRNFCSKI